MVRIRATVHVRVRREVVGTLAQRTRGLGVARK